MAKTESKQANRPEKGYVRLERIDAEGGFLDVPKKKAEKMLALEKRLGIKNYIESDSNGDSGPSEDQGTMGNPEK